MPWWTLNTQPLLDASNQALKMSAKAYQYDYNGNVTQTTDHDWFDPTGFPRDAQGVCTDARGKVTQAEIRESTSYTGSADTTWDRGAIINHYSDTCWGLCSGQSMTDNNGNLKKQEVYIPNSDTFAQFYSYDSLNRLQKVNESRNGAAVNWQQQYSYDRYGNRTIDQTNTWGTNIPKANFGVDTATNRLTAPVGSTMNMIRPAI
jgi:hypothetical protein